MNLNDREWKEFKIGELFGVSGTVTTKPQELTSNGNTPRITCSATDNGLDDFYSNEPTEKGGVITIDSATVGYISYQEYDFIATDHVEKIVDNTEIKRNKGLFLVTAFTNSCGNKYNYGYKFSQTRIARQTVKLPVDPNGLPDFDFMDAYVKEKEQKKIQSYLDYCKKKLRELGSLVYIDEIENKEWKEFFIDELFVIDSGKRLESYNMTDGTRPFIGATESGNGVTNYISNENDSLDKNVLGVNYNGNGMVISFYHPYECLFSDDVKRFHLKHNPDNKFVLLFFKSVILKQKIKYNYGYKFNANRMKRQIIMVPVDFQGQPDYGYMEQYSKNMMIKKYQEYLKYIKKTN